MATLSTAIERQDWEVVATCLLQGFIQTISRLPPETLQHMLEALEGENSAPEK